MALKQLNFSVIVQTDEPDVHLRNFRVLEQEMEEAVLGCITTKDEGGCTVKLLGVTDPD